MSAPPHRRRVRIRDVADAAGVSITTVSHALNDKGRVDPETRARIVALAEELGYRPNQNALNLLRQRSGMLAMTISSRDESPMGLLDLEFFVRFVNAATTEALDNGYALVLTPPRGAHTFDGVDVDGAIVVDPTRDDALLGALEQRGIPVVTSGRDLERPGIVWVDNDLARGMRLLLDHISPTASHIGLITYSQDYSFSVDTRDGYERWCRETGQRPVIAEASGGLTEDAGYAAALKLLRRRKRPDAICAAIDRHALGAVQAAESLGLAIPGDVQIACVTDSEAARSAKPAITALDLHPDTNGRRAVEALMRLIQGESAAIAPVPVDLVPRASTLGVTAGTGADAA